MKGKGFGFTHYQWKVLYSSVSGPAVGWLPSKSILCCIIFCWITSGPQVSPRGSGGCARVQVARPGFSLEGVQKKSGWGAVVSIMPWATWADPHSTSSGAFAYECFAAGLYKALQQPNTSCWFSKELLQGYSRIAHKDPRAPGTFLWRLWKLKGKGYSHLGKSLGTGPQVLNLSGLDSPCPVLYYCFPVGSPGLMNIQL